MIKTNAKWNIVFKFYNIQYVESDKRWYAWYDVKMIDAIKEEVNSMDGE